MIATNAPASIAQAPIPTIMPIRCRTPRQGGRIDDRELAPRTDPVLLPHPSKVVSMSRFVDELWGDALPATAAKVVQGYTSSLRKRIGRADNHYQAGAISRYRT